MDWKESWQQVRVVTFKHEGEIAGAFHELAEDGHSEVGSRRA